MGTDIHGVAQRRYYEQGEYREVAPIPRDRNYRLFAALASVRNGTGFAGVKTFDPIVPVAEPRGLPEDLGKRPYAYDDEGEELPDRGYREGDFGDHSYTVLYLSELLAYNWDQPIAACGIVERAEYDQLRIDGSKPESWCGGVSGPGVLVVEQEEVEAGTARAGYTHVRMYWEDKLSDSCQTFLAWMRWMELEHSWVLRDDPQAIRLIIGFDS